MSRILIFVALALVGCTTVPSNTLTEREESLVQEWAKRCRNDTLCIKPRGHHPTSEELDEKQWTSLKRAGITDWFLSTSAYWKDTQGRGKLIIVSLPFSTKLPMLHRNATARMCYFESFERNSHFANKQRGKNHAYRKERIVWTKSKEAH